MKKEQKSASVLPVRAVRIGNFKLWRGWYAVSSGKEKGTIACANVSNLDGSWMVRIPSTMTMYGTICNGYATTDDNLRNNFLGMLFSNMYNCCTCSSEALHDSFFFLTEMLTFPYLLLSEQEMKDKMSAGYKRLGIDKKQGDEHISKMCEYRAKIYSLIEQKKARVIESYERQREDRIGAEDMAQRQLDQDAIAEQAMDILDNGE